MSRLRLRLYVNPGAAEIFLNIQRKDGGFHPITANIDTGGQTTLLPDYLLENIEYRLAEIPIVEIEAFIRVFLEDGTGKRSEEFEMKAWFADTEVIVVGFEHILENSILHLDMPALEGWLEIDETRLK